MHLQLKLSHPMLCSKFTNNEVGTYLTYNNLFQVFGIENDLVCLKLNIKMSLHSDCSNALQLLEHIQQTIQETDDVKLKSQTNEDLSMLISVFSNPILRSLVCVEVNSCSHLSTYNICKRSSWLMGIHLSSVAHSF